MRVVFVCGFSFTDGNLQIASWAEGLLSSLRGKCDIDVVTVSTDSRRFIFRQEYSRKNQGIFVKLSVLSDKELETEFADFLRAVRPQVVILFGAENGYTYRVFSACVKNGLLQHTVFYSQGFCYPCGIHYAEGLPNRVIKRYTVRDILRRDNIADQIRSFEKRAKNEQKILSETAHFIGRTGLDKALLRLYNPSAVYHKCKDVLRDVFYDGEWTYEHCEPRRIFVSQYYYPLKGVHYLLKAVSMIKDRYPDLKIALAGPNPIHKDMGTYEWKDGSYIRYLKGLCKMYHLENCIELLGLLSAEEMKAQYLRANVYVMPSTIENSPNSLAEAMYLGVPAVASDVGGVLDYAIPESEALIYPSSAYYKLAYNLMRIFDSRTFAEQLGHAGRMRAQKEYDRETNYTEFLNTCMSIAECGEKSVE